MKDERDIVLDLRVERFECGDRYSHICGHTAEIRNAEIRYFSGSGWDETPSRYYTGLRISCQISAEHDSPYAFAIEYVEERVRLETAQRMAATLKRVHRCIDRDHERYGAAATYGAYVARFAHAVGARLVIRRQPQNGVELWRYPPGSAVSFIDHLAATELAWTRGEETGERAA